MRQRLGLILMAVLLLAIALCAAGCSGKPEEAPDNGGLQIVATIFPPYDFTRVLTQGTDADVTMLIKPGVESHTFDPSPSDILKIQDADLFVCIGGHDEAWVDTVLTGLDAWNGHVVRLIDCVETLPEDEHEHEHDHAHEAEHDEGIDEHIWTSPRNAQVMVREILNALCEVDPGHETVYQQNGQDYEAKLTELDTAFTDVVEHGARREVIFGDRFPFKYFAKAYGLDYYAAFSGCSGESEPSAADVALLIDRVRTDGIPVVYHIEQGSVKTADIIAEETGVETKLLHSCHNLTVQEFEGGESYLSLMNRNVEALKAGLSGEGD